MTPERRDDLPRTPPATNRPSDGRPLATSSRAPACVVIPVQSVRDKQKHKLAASPRSRSLRDDVSLSLSLPLSLSRARARATAVSIAHRFSFFSHLLARKYAARASERERRAAAAKCERGRGGPSSRRMEKARVPGARERRTGTGNDSGEREDERRREWARKKASDTTRGAT